MMEEDILLTIDQLLADPDSFIKTLQAYKEEKKLRQELEAQNKELEAKNLELEAEKVHLETAKSNLETKIKNDATKVEFVDALEQNPLSISIGTYAKILRNAGIKIGERRLFRLLYKHRYLIKNGYRRRAAYQKWVDRGYFEVIEKPITLKDGTTKLLVTTLLTGKGQRSLWKKIPLWMRIEDNSWKDKQP